MDYAKKELIKIKRMYVNLNSKYMKEIEDLPNGKLLMTDNRGYNLFQYARTFNGVYQRKGITKDADMIKALARREFLKRETELLENNIEVLATAIDRIRDVEPTTIIGSMTKAYRELPLEYFFNEELFAIDHKLKGEERIRMQKHIEWANAPFEQSTAYLESKNKITSFGLRVRSKSEQLIAERLHDFGVPFRYEAVIEVLGQKYAPDFTFEDAGLMPFYWEHAGIMDDYHYEQSHQVKLMNYRRAGIVPWDNLIVTYEKDGQLNMAMIDAIIQNEIIPRL